MTTVPPFTAKLRPRLLDLFCGAGGAAMGYHRAGFEVVGVDIRPQPNYPFEFHQSDALQVTRDNGAFGSRFWLGSTSLGKFDAIHASPPCQRYSTQTACRPGLAAEYPDLIAATRAMLDGSGVPYVIENVAGARKELRHPTMLCGAMFGKQTYRHRFFETTFPLAPIAHPKHTVPTSRAGHWKPGTYISVAGHVSPIALAEEVMAIDWMTRAELGEAIPPYFTEWIGAQLMRLLENAA